MLNPAQYEVGGAAIGTEVKADQGMTCCHGY